GSWLTRRFVGSEWKALKNARKREYLFNSYRVLLTRSRQGMVIWVPEGSADDKTRSPKWYDETADFLQSTGIQVVN
ncbi:MAG TPA: DNA/RNA helicase domain-containing protein, partial [Terriglobales bacterium]|nr:DNA/RNA helicase domain-containing protein [Terriglobales bacterium]